MSLTIENSNVSDKRELKCLCYERIQMSRTRENLNVSVMTLTRENSNVSDMRIQMSLIRDYSNASYKGE